MENSRAGAAQFVRSDSVRPQAQQLAVDAVGQIYAANLFVRRVLHREAFAPEKLREQAVEILRAGADNDLLRPHKNAPAAREIRRDGPPQLWQAVIRRFDEQRLPIAREHAPHRSGKDGKGEIPLRGAGRRRGQRAFGRRKHGEAVRIPINHKIAAALARFDISLVAENGAGVLHRDDAHARFRRDHPLAGQLRAAGINPRRDVVAQAAVKLHIGRLAAGLNIVSHLVL